MIEDWQTALEAWSNWILPGIPAWSRVQMKMSLLRQRVAQIVRSWTKDRMVKTRGQRRLKKSEIIQKFCSEDCWMHCKINKMAWISSEQNNYTQVGLKTTVAAGRTELLLQLKVPHLELPSPPQLTCPTTWKCQTLSDMRVIENRYGEEHIACGQRWPEEILLPGQL